MIPYYPVKKNSPLSLVLWFTLKLAGKLEDFYSIRINDQWLIIFKWNAGNAAEAEIIDYH
jgi:plasmid maintenance system killer protein